MTNFIQGGNNVPVVLSILFIKLEWDFWDMAEWVDINEK